MIKYCRAILGTLALAAATLPAQAQLSGVDAEFKGDVALTCAVNNNIVNVFRYCRVTTLAN